jgi:thioredoxin-like negative regulator of GroEL
MIEVLIEAERAMSFNLIDRAETLYRQVVAADPRNAIAVVGLARVALERGDEPGALALAREALAIDPENDKARRLAERLEEVLRTRGVEVAPAAVPTLPANPSQAPVVDGAPQTPAEVEVQPPRKRSLLDRLRGRG